MQRRSNVSPFLIVLIACFLLGMLSVFLRRAARDAEDANNAPTPAAVNLPVTEATPSSQNEVALLIGVDSLTASTPALRSVWLIEFHHSGRYIHFLGIPVDLQLGGPSTPSLEELFQFSTQRGLEGPFLSSVNLLAPHPADIHIVLDEVALETGLDFLGGVTLDEDSFTGSQIVRVLDLLSDDPSADLKMQSEILSELASHAFDLSTNLDISSLIGLIPEHAYISTDPLELSSLAASMLPVRPEDIVIELFIPTP